MFVPALLWDKTPHNYSARLGTYTNGVDHQTKTSANVLRKRWGGHMEIASFRSSYFLCALSEMEGLDATVQWFNEEGDWHTVQTVLNLCWMLEGLHSPFFHCLLFLCFIIFISEITNRYCGQMQTSTKLMLVCIQCWIPSTFIQNWDALWFFNEVAQ